MGYLLKIGTGAPATLASLGIESATLECDAIGRSSLTLEAAASLADAPIIAPFQKCELLDDEEAVLFAGWLDEAPRSARGSEHRASYKLTGPHRWLERSNFAQSRAGLVILGGSAGSVQTDPQAFYASAAEILDQALAIYPGAFAYTGTSSFTHETPTRFRADVDCLTALDSLLGYAPTAVLWWTYPAGVPTLNIGASAATADKTLSTATHQISAAELNPRYDLLHDTVTVYYVSAGTVSGAETSGPGGEAQALGAARTKLFTYDTSVLNNYPAAGMAAQFAAFYQRLHIDGEATRHDIDWTDLPGHVYGFVGADFAQFSDRTAVCHTLRRDLLAGTTRLELGVMPGKLLYKINDIDSTAPATTGSTYSAASYEATIPKKVTDWVSDGIPQTDVKSPKVGKTLADDLADKFSPDNPPTQQDVTDLADDLAAKFSPDNPPTQEDVTDLVESLDAKLDKPTGTPTTPPVWVEVERCDGKKMKVLAQASWA